MSEVNEFSSIRLSLASPTRVKDWSHGEITRAETINYRTLKPERDGLFCERIFGPQKDFECPCGKFKSQRYKGIVCDKCGVEVTRSKVRRERMGHIALAAPVTHIWFTKGIPSRLALLMDITPKILESVVYFDSYAVIAVDEETRLLEQARLDKMIESEVNTLSGGVALNLAEMQNEKDTEVNTIETEQVTEIAEVESEYQLKVSAIEEVAKNYLKEFKKLIGQDAKLKQSAKFGNRIFAKRGIVVDEVLLTLLEDGKASALAREEANYLRQHKRVTAGFAKRLREVERRFREPIADLTSEQGKVMETIRDRYREQLDFIGAVRDPISEDKFQTLSPADYDRFSLEFPGVFTVAMGAEAIAELLKKTDLDQLSARLKNQIINDQSDLRRKKAVKRLRVVDALRRSDNRPEWMIIETLPVLPPDLRPMVQLEGGRFATSDLNDLYRRVINRNNRLKRLLNLGAPEIIIRNEKRMLQESVDSLIDNGRRGRAVSSSGNHKLKSLSDLLKGKQGRFRQNLLGKRVDYSGRSVIIVGPKLKLHQCGLPKKMALELFKPFVMFELVKHGQAHNIKSAKRAVEQADGAVWDALANVVKDRPVLLNRAPTLHRLGIQAFEPVLVDGAAIQLHPSVCGAFNADFDGDQMAVHVPLSYESVAEARQLMLSTKNILKPSDGQPVVSPTLDIVVGCYYLTHDQRLNPPADRPALLTDDEIAALFVPDMGSKSQIDTSVSSDDDSTDQKMQFKAFNSLLDVQLWQETNNVHVHTPIELRTIDGLIGGKPSIEEKIVTTVGRAIFNLNIPIEIPYVNETMSKNALNDLVSSVYQDYGEDVAVKLVDDLKTTGFNYATKSGLTLATSDILPPEDRKKIIAGAEKKISELEDQWGMGEVGDADLYRGTIDTWEIVEREVQQSLAKHLTPSGPLAVMMNSGAKGSPANLRQMAGFMGRVTDPKGQVIRTPVYSSLRDGLSAREYFISTHGARKGLTDTALRTADAGYLTRRMIDVAQDVVVYEGWCVPEDQPISGLDISRYESDDDQILGGLSERIAGRWTASPVIDPDTGEVLLDAKSEITEETARAIEASQVQVVTVCSPATCKLPRGICQYCYGHSMTTKRLVDSGTAVGIIAAQSIGEPGTQLTLRTFHGGGAVGLDITLGLPRVEELVEARSPKGEAPMAEHDGWVYTTSQGRSVSLLHAISEQEVWEQPLPLGYSWVTKTKGTLKLKKHEPLAQVEVSEDENSRNSLVAAPIIMPFDGDVEIRGDVATITRSRVSKLPAEVVHRFAPRTRREIEEDLPAQKTIGEIDPNQLAFLEIPKGWDLMVEDGDEVAKGDLLAVPVGTKIPATTRARLELAGFSSPFTGVINLVEGAKATYIVYGSTYQGAARAGLYRGLYQFAPVSYGDQLMEGSLNLQQILRMRGEAECQSYITKEIQRVYRTQGVFINDRHIEIIVRQMLRRVEVVESGDSDYLDEDRVDRISFEAVSKELVADGKTPPEGNVILLGVTRASLATESFLAAASFQETTKVLTEAAVAGKVDHLWGLKENVIIGKLIPAQAEVVVERPEKIPEMAIPESLMLPFLFEFEQIEAFGEDSSEAPSEAELAAVGMTTQYIAEPE